MEYHNLARKEELGNKREGSVRKTARNMERERAKRKCNNEQREREREREIGEGERNKHVILADIIGVDCSMPVHRNGGCESEADQCVHQIDFVHFPEYVCMCESRTPL